MAYIILLVTVIKPDESEIVCLDTRRLNQVMFKDHEQPRPQYTYTDQDQQRKSS